MKRLLLALIILSIPLHVSAETIKLRDGRVIKSKIVRRTDQYIRIEPIYGFPEKEFLLQNISSITSDKGVEVFASQEVFKEELKRSVVISSLDQAPEEVKIKAREMAAALVQEALRNIQLPEVESSSPAVRQVAQQKANQILEDAMKESGVSDAVKKTAKEMAEALIEETVKSSAVPSLENAPRTIKEIAKEKASNLIAEAMGSSGIDSLHRAPSVVKEAAKQSANKLIDEAMNDTDVEGLTKNLKSDDGFIVKSGNEIWVENAQGEKSNETMVKQTSSKSNEISPQQAKALLQEAVTRRVNETTMKDAVVNITQVSGQPVSEDEIVFVEEDVVDQNNMMAAEDDMSLDDFLESPDQIDFDEDLAAQQNRQPPVEPQEESGVVEDVEDLESIELEDVDAEQIMQKYGVIDELAQKEPMHQEAPMQETQMPVKDMDAQLEQSQQSVSEETMEKSSFKLGWVHYLIVLVILGLGFFLFKSRSKGSGSSSKGGAADVSVLSSMTYQNLDDAIKQKITSSDVTMILRLSAEYQLDKERNAKKGELVVIETQELVDFIEIKAKQAGGFFTSDDIQKVLEVSESAQENL